MIAVALVLSSCAGMGHRSAPCSTFVKGKYYRATRFDVALIIDVPLVSPLVLATDLPFALIIETIEVPFVAMGDFDPRPNQLKIHPNFEDEKTFNQSTEVIRQSGDHSFELNNE